MARYQEQFGFRTTSGDTGAAAASNNLASRLGGFSNTMLQQHQQNRISDAQEDAAMADPRKGELVNKKTVYGRQYNDTLIKAHQAAVKSDYSLTLERFANESPNNPIEFQKKVDSVRDSTLKQAIPETRQMLEIGFDNLAGSYQNKIAAKSKADFTKAAMADEKIGLQASLDDMMRFVRNGDDKSAADEFFAYSAMVGASDLSEAEQGELIGKAKQGIIEQTYLDDLEGQSTVEAMASIEALSQDVPDSHTVEDWGSFLGQAQTETSKRKQRLAQDDAELSLGQSRFISDLEVEVNGGGGDIVAQSKAVNDLFDKGWIKAPKRTSLLSKIAKNSKEAIESAEMVSSIAKRINGDPSVVIDRAEADKVWDKTLKKVYTTPAHKVALVDSLKYMPKGMEAQLSNDLRGGNKELIEEAADMIDRLSFVRGLPDNSISAQDVAYAHEITSLSKYLDLPKAIEQANKNTDPYSVDRIESRKAIINQDKRAERQSGYGDKVDAGLDYSFFGNSVDEYHRAEMVADYGRMYESNFVAGMTSPIAHEETLKAMKRVWSPSNATGKTVTMKYPPEMIYSLGDGDDKWMQRQLKSDAKQAWAARFQGENVPPMGDIVLFSDDQTARQAKSGQATYLMYIKTIKGLEPLYDRWLPDQNARMKEIMKEDEANMEKGRADKLISQEAAKQNLETMEWKGIQ